MVNPPVAEKGLRPSRKPARWMRGPSISPDSMRAVSVRRRSFSFPGSRVRVTPAARWRGPDQSVECACSSCSPGRMVPPPQSMTVAPGGGTSGRILTISSP